MTLYNNFVTFTYIAIDYVVYNIYGVALAVEYFGPALSLVMTGPPD